MDWKFLLFSLVVAGAAGILLILAMVSPTAFTIALSLALLYPLLRRDGEALPGSQ